ncbi:hypothetical protein [Halogeometricum luteum]|uniref:Energy-coupling factor transport system substrate-specific component n=1 Tax=Halogeometricum luteum TaxID=2950537 RepID=A0ABU2G1H2_9EURY|nr:hypothetical protein [Halogeometricum sp. S3BR5-2]MDS0294630.1 hypothetical protein [Halogeometricum sp. S3BR5-2]
MSQTGLRSVVESQRVNTILSWLLVSFLLVAAAGQFADGELQWAGFTLAVAAVALVPAIALRNPTSMLPWEVLFLAALPIIARALVTGETVGGMTFTGRVATYLAVAAVALIVAVELDVFTSIRMNHSFAVAFVVVTTMAAAGVWAVVRWASDTLVGTAFLYDGRAEAVIEEALMWDFVAATVAGVFAGVLFEYYFRRLARLHSRLPEGDAGARPAAEASNERETEARR